MWITNVSTTKTPSRTIKPNAKPAKTLISLSLLIAAILCLPSPSPYACLPSRRCAFSLIALSKSSSEPAIDPGQSSPCKLSYTASSLSGGVKMGHVRSDRRMWLPGYPSDDNQEAHGHARPSGLAGELGTAQIDSGWDKRLPSYAVTWERTAG